MVRLGCSALDQNQPVPNEIQRVIGHRQRIALAVLLTGRFEPEDPAVKSFLLFTEQHQMNLDQCWVITPPPEVSQVAPPAASPDAQASLLAASASQPSATNDSGHESAFKPMATWLMIPSAGRVAMAFMSAVTGRRAVKTTAQLIQAACNAQDPKQLRLIQVLLDPSQRLEQQATTDAGFSHLATLLYMHRFIRPPAPAPGSSLGNTSDSGGISSGNSENSSGDSKDTSGGGGSGGGLGKDFEVYHWSPANRERFEAAIRLSYEGTLDCPALRGVRHMDDIITGHMAAGEFDPKRWYALYKGDEPQGVLLLNKVFGRRALEVVYLGLTPMARGHGLGSRLVQTAVDLAGEEQMDQLILAVDEKNRPARRLYQRFDFVISQRKAAMIYLLPEHDPKP